LSADDARLAIDQHELADSRWRAALELSAEAPPDLNLASRVRAIADAAEQQAAAFRHSDALSLGWRAQSSAGGQYLSYELRAGAAWRRERGSPELWERFDAAVEQLWAALEGVALSAIARAFAAVSDVTRQLADEIEAIDSDRLRRRQPPMAGRQAG
jgi:hypothetical protein